MCGVQRLEPRIYGLVHSEAAVKSSKIGFQGLSTKFLIGFEEYGHFNVDTTFSHLPEFETIRSSVLMMMRDH